MLAHTNIVKKKMATQYIDANPSSFETGVVYRIKKNNEAKQYQYRHYGNYCENTLKYSDYLNCPPKKCINDRMEDITFNKDKVVAELKIKNLSLKEDDVKIYTGVRCFQHMTLVVIANLPDCQFSTLQLYNCNRKYQSFSVMPGHPSLFGSLTFRIIQLWNQGRLLPYKPDGHKHFYIAMNPNVLGHKKDYWLEPIPTACNETHTSKTVENKRKLDVIKIELARKTLTKYSRMDELCCCPRCC